jgi:hypothetical protein
VIGAGVGLGIAAALAVLPDGTPTVAGVAGVAVGVLAWAAFRVLPRTPRIAEPVADATDDENWVDDGSGQHKGWSGRDTRDLSAFHAWEAGGLPDQDATGVMPSPTWETSAPPPGQQPYQPRHCAVQADAGVR